MTKQLKDYLRMTRKTMGSERNLIQGKEKPSSQSSLKSQKREIKLFLVVAYCLMQSSYLHTDKKNGLCSSIG